MGMPVISTDCPSGGPRMLIENEINGFLIHVNNADELEEKMMLIANTEVGVKVGKAAEKLKDQVATERVFEEWKNFLFNK